MPARRRRAAALKLRLLELPSAWLVLLVQALPADRLLALLRTCQQLRDLVLQHAPRVSLYLLLQAVSPGQASRCLQLASQHCHKLGLKVLWEESHFYSRIENELWPLECTPVFHSVLTSCSSMLANVTRLHLMHTYVEGVLPPAIRQAMPHLSSLTLSRCCLHWDICTPASFQGSLPLDSLRLINCRSRGSISPWQQQLQAQLAQLTGLKALQLAEHCKAAPLDLEVYNLIGCAVPAHQLTYLHVRVQPALYIDHWPLPPLHLAWLQDSPAWAHRLKQHLQQLCLPGTKLDDAGLGVVLQMASLTFLKVASFRLKASSAHQQPPAQLQRITCSDLQLQQLAWLPLNSTSLAIEVGSASLMEPDLDVQDADLIKEAAQNVARCQGVHWKSEVHLRGDWHHLIPEEQQQLMATLLQLVDAPVLVFEVTSLHPQVKGVLVEHMQASLWLRKLVFPPKTCPFSAADKLDLTRQLPNGMELDM